MKVKAYNVNGKPVWDKQGELVCEAPAPSMPLYFWNDPNGEKYKSAYFEYYPNVWRHGDYVVFHSDTKGITFYGRSDAVLKPSGVRIGTAEIYNVVERIEGSCRQPGYRTKLGRANSGHPLRETSPGREFDRGVEEQDQKDPKREGLSPPCSIDHHGNARSPLYNEYEEGGERGHQYHPRKAGSEQGCSGEPTGSGLLREDRPGAPKMRMKGCNGVKGFSNCNPESSNGIFVMKLTRKEFEEAVVAALKRLPKFIKEKMENVDVVVEDRAPQDLVTEMGLHSSSELLGLYQGVPLDRRGFYYGNVLPDKITLFQVPIESICKTKEEVKEKVREVVIHEVGHYFGLDDERLRELEEE